MLSEKTKQLILRLQERYPVKRSALIPSLHLAQSEVGYLPLEVQQEVADLFDLELNEVNGVVTFYDMFFEKPVGKHLIHVCKNVSCMLRGSDELMGQLCHRLKITTGETSEDGEFTLIASECLGACDRAPMMLLDDQVVGPVKEGEVDHLLEDAKHGAGHPSPMKVMESIHE